MVIWLPEKFYKEAEAAVSQREKTGDCQSWSRLGRKPPNNDEQGHAFQCNFVKLRRMAGELINVGKHHSPGHICRLAPKFATDKVAKKLWEVSMELVEPYLDKLPG